MNLPATNVNIDKMKATQRYDREPIQHIDNDVIIPKKAIAPDPMMNTRTKSNAENENKILIFLLGNYYYYKNKFKLSKDCNTSKKKLWSHRSGRFTERKLCNLIHLDPYITQNFQQKR